MGYPVGYPVDDLLVSLHTYVVCTLRRPRLHCVLIKRAMHPRMRESVMIALGWNLVRGSERASKRGEYPSGARAQGTYPQDSIALTRSSVVVQRVLSVDCYRSMSIELSLEMNVPLGISTTYRLGLWLVLGT